MTERIFIQREDVEPVEMLPGVLRRTLGVSDHMMVCEVTLIAGSAVPAHQHPNEQTGYIVSGQVEFTIGDEVRTLSPGDSYAIPGGVVHSARPLVTSVVIDIFSPPREDYRV